MKNYINTFAAQTQSIGESASDILRRLLNLPTHATSSVDFFESVASAETPKVRCILSLF